MSEKREDVNPDDPVTIKLCEAYRKLLEEKIGGISEDVKDLKGYMEKIDGRLWKTLAGVIVTILLTIIGIVA